MVTWARARGRFSAATILRTRSTRSVTRPPICRCIRIPGLPADPQQRAVSRREKARAQDVSVERLTAAARTLLQDEIGAAHGREVSFVVRADPNGTLTDARVVARGTIDAVLALPGVAQRGEMVLHNHPSGFLEPSGADLHVAARLHDEGAGFGIVNNDVTTLYVVVECPRARSLARLDAIAVANLLTESGPVARVLGNSAFEDRPGQRDMT